MITHPSVAGAAMLAGLLVAGGSYAARHDLGLGSALPASANARARLERELTVVHVRHHHQSHLLAWHPPHVPKIRVQQQAPAPVVVVSAPAPVTTVAPAPLVTAAAAPTPAPVTRTSPVGGDDGGGDD